MTGPFGIDHPLIAVHEINRLRDLLVTLGFTMTPVGRHPWGTSTSLAMFEGCLIEIMGIHDASLIHENPAGDFHFGAHVHAHLEMREGVALTALHSTDARADARAAEAAGLTLAGHLEFGRDVTLPDGRRDRTKTTLALLPDAAFPRLSFFLCQQHRPDLIYVPDWLQHPNSACGIAGVTIRAEACDQPALRRKLTALYGGAQDLPGGFSVETANGAMQVLDAARVAEDLTPLPDDVVTDPTPGIVGMDIRIRDRARLLAHLRRTGLRYDDRGAGLTLTEPEQTGNVIFRFCEG